MKVTCCVSHQTQEHSRFKCCRQVFRQDKVHAIDSWLTTGNGFSLSWRFCSMSCLAWKSDPRMHFTIYAAISKPSTVCCLMSVEWMLYHASFPRQPPSLTMQISVLKVKSMLWGQKSASLCGKELASASDLDSKHITNIFRHPCMLDPVLGED